jgi:two-component system sensor histidine kinase DegS
MDVARVEIETDAGRFDGLVAEASAAVGYGANTLRTVRERYREAYADALTRWQALRDELEQWDRAPASAREAGAGDAGRQALRLEVEQLGRDIGVYQSTLTKLDVAERSLSRTRLFLERGDASLEADPDDGGPLTEGDVAMRIIEAQEAERAHLAQEIHDGPAQALSNAIFQADYLERLATEQPAQVGPQLRDLRGLLRRELANVRDAIHQLRPVMLDELGLDGAIEEAVARLRGMTGLAISTDLHGPNERLDDRQQTVALRVAQEALQNVRKHAAATNVVVRTGVDGDDWVLEIRDDGRGFDIAAVAARGLRNFGLQFMRERAGLIGSRLDVRSVPDGGTVVRLVIPTNTPTGPKENG